MGIEGKLIGRYVIWTRCHAAGFVSLGGHRHRSLAVARGHAPATVLTSTACWDVAGGGARDHAPATVLATTARWDVAVAGGGGDE